TKGMCCWLVLIMTKKRKSMTVSLNRLIMDEVSRFNLEGVTMSKEIELILRALLFQAMQAESKEEIELAIRAMCSKDDIAAVKEQIAELKLLKERSQR
ncbi:MAG: hypothetical protein FWG67_02345, partial [Defluviitaleaceae bacterium]|nr:hypothetical protein [Defluviitaleaceae bacterium]